MNTINYLFIYFQRASVLFCFNYNALLALDQMVDLIMSNVTCTIRFGLFFILNEENFNTIYFVFIFSHALTLVKLR